MQPLEVETHEFDIEVFLEQFDVDQASCAKLVRTFARFDPLRFLELGLQMFQQLAFSPALRCVGMTLVQDERLPLRVLELIGQPREDVSRLVRKLMSCDPLFDLKILETLRLPGRRFDNGAIVQVLDILDVVSVNIRLVPLVQEMLKEADPRIQSKAVAFIGRRTQNLSWAQRQMQDANPRIRANVVESLYGVSCAVTGQMMLNLVGDDNNRVVGNALLGLHRLGDTNAVSNIFRMAVRPEAEFRSTAAWVMGASGDPRFNQVLASMLQDAEKQVRKNALLALQNIRKALNAAAEKPELQISVVGLRRHDNCSSLTVVLQDNSGNPPMQVSPTSWVLIDEDKVVCDYSVESLECPNSLSVAFLTAEAAEAGNVDFGDALASITRCLPFKRLDDRWAILKMKSAPSGMAGTGDFEVSQETLLHIRHVKNSGQTRVRIPVSFSRSIPEIQSMLATDAMSVGITAVEAIQRASYEVLQSREMAGEKQHLICLGPTGMAGLLENAAVMTTECRVAVHVITLQNADRAEEIRALTELTGGSYVLAPSLAAIPERCEVLLKSLRSSYQLNWQGRFSRLTVKLYAESGRAIAHWPPDFDAAVSVVAPLKT